MSRFTIEPEHGGELIVGNNRTHTHIVVIAYDDNPHKSDTATFSGHGGTVLKLKPYEVESLISALQSSLNDLPR